MAIAYLQSMKNNNKASEVFTSPELFTFEQWPVYKASLELCAKVFDFRIINSKMRCSFLCDQFKKASASIPLNLSEGYSRFTRRDKLSFLRIAKGSAFECVSIINILRQAQSLDEHNYKLIYSLLLNISKMLTGMINNLVKNR